MTDDICDVTDAMWAQYAAALLREAVGDDFDAATQVFSIGSVLLFVDVAAADPAIANYSVFRLGNSIPPWSGSYIATTPASTQQLHFLWKRVTDSKLRLAEFRFLPPFGRCPREPPAPGPTATPLHVRCRTRNIRL